MNDFPSNDRPRVLVIDDDPLFRSLIMSLLRKDYLVAVASDGAEGYFKAAEHPPDIVLIDVQMPGWDGIKTLKHFRAHPSLSKVSLVMLTSDSSRETVMAAIQAGAHDYIVKTSFSKEDLFNKLARFDPRRRTVMQRVEAQAAAALVGSRSSSASPATGFAPSPTTPPTPIYRSVASSGLQVPPPNHREAFLPVTSGAEAELVRSPATAAVVAAGNVAAAVPRAASRESGTETYENENTEARVKAEDNYDSRLRELIDDWN
jgi:DNA-binding NarL/FixJ family response regulator